MKLILRGGQVDRIPGAHCHEYQVTIPHPDGTQTTITRKEWVLHLEEPAFDLNDLVTRYGRVRLSAPSFENHNSDLMVIEFLQPISLPLIL